MSHGNEYILGSKGPGSTSRDTKNSAGVGVCTLVSAGFFYFELRTAATRL